MIEDEIHGCGVRGNNEIEIEKCKDYKYLEVNFNETEADNKKIKRRIVQARRTISSSNSILWSKETKGTRVPAIFLTNRVMEDSN